ncbi:hypothetical protein [Burkholderia phage vB_BpP_HN03]|uniref:Uncharacterized protein n=1 Tax=Burkholderia phage vB_BpP_HN02 TaxID=3116925 RepID=A0AAX4JJ59_9CAUD
MLDLTAPWYKDDSSNSGIWVPESLGHLLDVTNTLYTSYHFYCTDRGTYEVLKALLLVQGLAHKVEYGKPDLIPRKCVDTYGVLHMAACQWQPEDGSLHNNPRFDVEFAKVSHDYMDI